MTFGAISSDQVLTRGINFSGAQFGKGSTAPTDVLLGTSPEVPALLFDAAAETASVYTKFLPDMDLSQDMAIRVEFSLVNVETDGLPVEITFNYNVPALGITGSGPTKTSTQVNSVKTVTSGEGLAIGDLYELSATISSADATNPLPSGAAIAIEMNLTAVTGVSAIHVLDADLEYTALY